MKIEFDEATIEAAYRAWCKTITPTPEFFALFYAAEANKQLEAAQAQLEKEQKPVFEEGKSYRTRGGGVAEVMIIFPNDVFPIKGKINGVSSPTWRSSGSFLQTDVHSPFDLLPGAIEDEQKGCEPSESHWQTRAEKAEAALERVRDLIEDQLRISGVGEYNRGYDDAFESAASAAGFRIVPAQPLTVVRDEV